MEGLFADSIAPTDIHFGFNKDFADRLEHNKKREELHRLKERHPKLAARLELEGSTRQVSALATGGESEEVDDSAEEVEDEGEISRHADRKFLRMLARIRNRDQTLYKETTKESDGSSSSSGSGSGSEDEKAPAGSSKPRPAYLKDVLARQAMADLQDDSDSDGDASGEERAIADAKPTYVQEQQDLRDAFLQAAEGSDAIPEQNEFGGMLLKTRAERDSQQRQVLTQLVDEAYNPRQQLTKDDQFLRSFLLNEGWKDKGERPDAEEVVESDEEFVEAAEQFEARYNFRFEEEGADKIRGHARAPEGLIRRVDDTRKRARERQNERRKEQQEQYAQEVKRLKGLRRQEVHDKLQHIQEVAGSGAPTQDIMDKLMAGDFNSEEYDAAMAAAFGDDYYVAEGEGSDPEDMEPFLEDSGLPDQDNLEQRSKGFSVLHSRLVGGAEGPAAAEAASRSAAEIRQLLEQYNALEYEDHVGGVATRFRYRQVPQADYGMNIEQLLSVADKDLNQVVGLKRLAPYRLDGGISRPNFGKLRELQASQAHKSRPQKPRKRGLDPAPTPDSDAREEPPEYQQSALESEEHNAAPDQPEEQASEPWMEPARQVAVDSAQAVHDWTGASHAPHSGSAGKKRKRRKTAGAYGSKEGNATDNTQHGRMQSQGTDTVAPGTAKAEQGDLTKPSEGLPQRSKAQRRAIPTHQDVHRLKTASAEIGEAQMQPVDLHQPQTKEEKLQQRLKTYGQGFQMVKPAEFHVSKSRKQGEGSNANKQADAAHADGQQLSKAQRRNARRTRLREDKNKVAAAAAPE